MTDLLEKIAEEGFADELEKIAKKDGPGWWAKEKGIGKAMGGDNKVFVKGEVLKGRLKGMGKGALVGTPIGSAAGAGIGALLFKGNRKAAAKAGAILGGLLGADVGSDIGSYKFDKKYLANKGITLKNFGMSSDFSPSAKAKYIDKK